MNGWKRLRESDYWAGFFVGFLSGLLSVGLAGLFGVLKFKS